MFGKKKERSIDVATYHISGLPIPDGVSCLVQWKGDKITFLLDGNNQYHLSLEKIEDIIIKTETEIQQAYVSNAGGAIAGAALFGPLGAIIGGRPKEKQVSNNTYYLAVSYRKSPDQETEIILFKLDSAPEEFVLAQKIVRAYRVAIGGKVQEQPKEIEL